MTQHEAIYKYIERFGSITPMDAFSDLGITKLATRVGEMRASGTEIIGTWETAKNRFGKKVRYMRYSFAE